MTGRYRNRWVKTISQPGVTEINEIFTIITRRPRTPIKGNMKVTCLDTKHLSQGQPTRTHHVILIRHLTIGSRLTILRIGHLTNHNGCTLSGGVVLKNTVKIIGRRSVTLLSKLARLRTRLLHRSLITGLSYILRETNKRRGKLSCGNTSRRNNRGHSHSSHSPLGDTPRHKVLQ